MGADRERAGLTKPLLAVLGFLAMTASLSINMYLPGFTAMSAQLGVPASGVQVTMTACLVGLAVGQLTLGPLSDRFGRRAVLCPALALYSLAGVAIALSGDISGVLVFRFVEGFAAAAGMAIPRAIAADLTRGASAVRVLSLIAMFVAVGPLVSPLLGGLIIEHFGWQGVFWALGAIGLLMLVLTIVLVPESLPHGARLRGGFFSTYRSFGPLLRDLRFVAPMLSYAFGFAALMSFVSATPFVAQNLFGLTPLQFSLILGAGAGSMVIATMLNAGFAGRTTPAVMLSVGGGVMMLASCVLLGTTLAGALVPAVLVASAMMLYFSSGFINSNSTALALARASATRGAGAALLGTSQFVIGGALSPLVGLGGESSALPLAVICVGCGTIVVTMAVILRRPVR